MSKESKTTPSLSRVFALTRDKKHGKELTGALAQHFDLSVFDDTQEAREAMATIKPDVVLAEADMLRTSHLDWLVRPSGSPAAKSPALIFISKKDEDLSDLLSVFGKTSRFLRWPISSRALIETISDQISQMAESTWDDLPEIERKPLKMTIEGYQVIAAHIEKGEPIDYDAAAASCAPLLEAINGKAHHAILKSVQSHHNYTYVHSMRVATLLTLFGYGIGIDGNDLLVLSTGGLLHDVGKLVTPSAILNKPGKLSDEEWLVMREHVVHSGVLLDNGNAMAKGVHIIAKQHHEKLDGTGYPNGLKGRELNELARMSAITDIFGALTDQRTYKPAFTAEKAFEILQSMGRAIDQNLLRIFRSIFTSTQPTQQGT